jgi:hypothetical protein
MLKTSGVDSIQEEYEDSPVHRKGSVISLIGKSLGF